MIKTTYHVQPLEIYIQVELLVAGDQLLSVVMHLYLKFYSVIMKLGSKQDLLDTSPNLKCKQIYWSKYLQSVEKIQWKL